MIRTETRRFAMPLTIALCLLPGIAPAQEDLLFDGCDIAPSDYATVVEEALIGTWFAQQGGGVAAVPGLRTVAVPASGATEIFTFAGGPGALTLASALFNPIPVSVVQGLEISDEYGLPQADGSQAMLDMVTVEAPDCDTTILPVVRASGLITGQDGNPGQAEAYLHFLNEDSLSGIWMVTGLGDVQVQYRVFMTLWR